MNVHMQVYMHADYVCMSLYICIILSYDFNILQYIGTLYWLFVYIIWYFILSLQHVPVSWHHAVRTGERLGQAEIQ